MFLLDQILVAQFKSLSSVETFLEVGLWGETQQLAARSKCKGDHLQKVPTEMEEELPYKLLTLSHGLQCPHQLSLPLLTVHYTKYDF